MTELDLVPDRSRVRIRTFAEGLFARLAHDLELVCTSLSGSGERSAGSGSAKVEVPIRAIEVAGILGKDGRVDERGMSTNDRHDCLEKMQKDVFQAAPSSVIRIEATLDGKVARVRVITPNGRTVERTGTVDLTDEDGGARVRGKFDLSLSSIGSSPVKGPMNAFRVKDIIEIHFDVFFATR